MSESGGPLRIVLAPSAQRDIHDTLVWSHDRFGARAAARYRELLKQALRDIAADPERPGSQERRNLARGVRTYHLSFSRDRVRNEFGMVKTPRHFLVYRRRGKAVIDVVRVLHDARDLDRHLPEGYLGDPGLPNPDET